MWYMTLYVLCCVPNVVLKAGGVFFFKFQKEFFVIKVREAAVRFWNDLSNFVFMSWLA